VIVTGAAGGMGSLLVRRFLGNGDTVLATDIKGDGLARLQPTSTPATACTSWPRTSPTRRLVPRWPTSHARVPAGSTCW
jgi:NAD(P)-dependent dehydrogenase (short-subunit alcohol dehydrogenase family)